MVSSWFCFDSFEPPRYTGEGEFRQFRKDQSKYPQGRSGLKEMVCRDVGADWNEKTKKKSNREGQDPTTLQENS